MKENIHLGSIILAAGRGSRMRSKGVNKVTLLLANKPLILHSIHLLERMKFEEIVVVIGFAKQSVKNVLKDSRVVFAEQKKRLGTGHAVKTAIEKLDSKITDVLVIYGDDSHFYNKEIISKLTNTHRESEANVTLLTITADNPEGLGRVLRDNKGKVTAVIEEKDASQAVLKIKEINPACYMFKVSFLKKYLKLIEKSKVTGEYYLTSIIDIARKHKETIETVPLGKIKWRGVNTKEELMEAEKLYHKLVE